jgi:hypothetical protein
MPSYWVKRATGEVIGEILTPNPVPHSDWLIVEVASLPGPIETVRWQGGIMVVDTSRTEQKRENVRRDVWIRLDKAFDFSYGGKNYSLNLAQGRALTAMEPRARRAVAQNDATWTLILKADDGTYSTLTAANVIDVCERVGNRLKNRWNDIMVKLQALDTATAAELGSFDPDVN